MPDEWRETSAEITSDVVSMTPIKSPMVAQPATVKDDPMRSGTDTTVKYHKLDSDKLPLVSENGPSDIFQPVLAKEITSIKLKE